MESLSSDNSHSLTCLPRWLSFFRNRAVFVVVSLEKMFDSIYLLLYFLFSVVCVNFEGIELVHCIVVLKSDSSCDVFPLYLSLFSMVTLQGR